MKQLTIRGFDAELEGAIRALAEREGISLNQAVLRLLRRGAKLEGPAPARPRIGDALDDLAGTWTEEDEREFLESIASLEEIDEEWR